MNAFDARRWGYHDWLAVYTPNMFQVNNKFHIQAFSFIPSHIKDLEPFVLQILLFHLLPALTILPPVLASVYGTYRSNLALFIAMEKGQSFLWVFHIS